MQLIGKSRFGCASYEIDAEGSLLLFLFLLFLVLRGGVALAVDVIVPDDFLTIQEAIDGAQAGDTVIVEPGDYTENITLRNDIDVRGREAARTSLIPETIDPTVQISGLSDVVFSNFTLIDATIGVEVINSTGITIASSVFDTVEQTAIDTDQDSAVEVINNVFWSNATAIQRSATDTQINNNIFSSNTQTITSPANTVDSNTNVDFNCFFDNNDLKQGDVDTALGTNFQIGDPLFVTTDSRDFHLRQNSPCIDAGSGIDVIDNTVSDMGAYGGDFADARPYPVSQPTVEDRSAAPPPPFSIRLTWERNLSHLVTNSVNPGGYSVNYRMNQSGPPYDGIDAGGGAQPSPISVSSVGALTLGDLQPSVAAPPSAQLLSAEARNEAVILTWSQVVEATGYRVFYGINALDENRLDVGDVTSFTATGLQNATVYRFAVVALTQPIYFFAVTAVDNTQNRNESVFSEEQSLRIGLVVESTLSNELTVVPEETLPFPDLPDEGCFIATAAYSHEWVAEVQVLRDFRDRYLLTRPLGRAFVRFYYATSPPVARYLNAHPNLKPLVRIGLLPVVVGALFMLSASWLTKTAVLFLLASLVWRVFWRRRMRNGRVRRWTAS